MPVVSLVSAKGSPGVTTVAAALATAAVSGGQWACWVELDPSGGSGWLRSRASCPTSGPTLAELACDVRDAKAVNWAAVVTRAPPDVPAVLAPSSEVAASAVISAGPGRWAEAIRPAGLVLLDAGRWASRQSTASRIVGSDIVGVVCRSTVEGVEHARHWVPSLRETARCPVVVIVVGTKPYRAEEVAGALRVPLGGVLQWRSADVGGLWARGAKRKQVAGSWLGRSAAATLAGVLQAAAPPVPWGLAARLRSGEVPVGRLAEP